ncbi:hypothetical protein TBR22_A35380 [Luteitalea sp. TBR-22]|uniref:hypothetical protein n=1 Tax=Luteitalea sp. TBR-22 TaxID=2802971 RepID=UPI001AF0AD09|nr:hypothetical protein [Luteitalea sp. TBR-22]BCS34308.1 hypothetical protein TBR22_A35380 [Luteitalea sp. TBR-22]
MRVPAPLLRFLLLLIVVAAVIGLRQPDKVLYPQFWAEDASIFYLEAEHLGTDSLWHPYNGYWHAYSRSFAWAGTRIPIRLLPAWYALAGLVATVLALHAALRLWPPSAHLARAAAVGVVVLAPFTDELWLTLTNSQWFGALLLVAELAGPAPLHATTALCRLGLVAVMALSGPFGLLLLPVAAWRAWWHRDAWSRGLLATFAAAAAVTALALAHHPRTAAATGLADRVGELWSVITASPLRAGVLSGGMSLLVATMAVGVGRRRWPVVACSVGSLCLVAVTLATVPPTQLVAGRYMFVPWVCGLWAALLLASEGMRRAWLPVALALGLALARFRLPAMQHYDWASDAACLEAREACDMLVNPGWPVGLPGRGPLPPEPR